VFVGVLFCCVINCGFMIVVFSLGVLCVVVVV